MAQPASPEEPARPRRNAPLLLLGGAAALAAGLGAAWLLVGRGGGGHAPPPASQGGLVIETGAPDAGGRIDPGKALRCFVQGRFVGELTLTECARRNGVATDALDVGVDPDGALAAADQAGETITPLPPVQDPSAQADPAAPPPFDASAQGAGSTCWRYGGGRWRKLGDMDQNACLQALYAGTCEKPGMATYGRWGQQTLRRVPGRIEASDDNRSFRTLVPQTPPECAVPPLG